MKLKYLIVAILFIITAQAYAQGGRQVSGVVKDTTGTTLPGTIVKMFIGKDSIPTTTDANGKFTFQGITANQFYLTVYSIGYQGIKRKYNLNNPNPKADADLGFIVLKSDIHMLNTVNIVDVNAIKLKEDTVEYNAAAYKVREGAVVEDAIKKMPGLDVDKDGNITAQGKSVTKVRLNGKDYMAGDVTSLTRNLPADLVQSVQIVDDYGDQANITGIKTGDPQKVLNINIRQDKNYGYFGQGTLGGGRDDIPEVDGTKDADRFVASSNLFTFNGNRQIAVSENVNNTNTNLFNFGGGGPGGRGGGPPGGNNSSNANGITTAHSFGLNYRDSWSKKVTVYGSYSFADNTLNTTTLTNQTNFALGQTSGSLYSNSVEKDVKLNHRFNFNIEWRPDSLDYFKITPTYSYGGVNTTQNAQYKDTYPDTTRNSIYNLALMSRSSAPNFGLNVLFNHRFVSHRNISILLTSGSTTSDIYQAPNYTYLAGKANAPLQQQITTNSRTDSVGTSFSYLEPLGKLSYLELNYGYHYSHTSAEKVTDTIADDGTVNQYNLLSNDYSFNFITNRFGVNYRYIDKKFNYTLGVAAQPTLLEGSSLVSAPTHNATFDFSPVARFVYNFSRSQALSVNYSGASNTPSYTYLQPVIDFSTAQFPVQGNPNLNPEYSNILTIRYNKFDFASGNVFFSNLNFTQTDNKIVANSITYPSTFAKAVTGEVDPKLANTILTQYLNASGYYSASAFYLYAKPWDKRKFTLFINGNLSYSNNISYISNVDSNINETTQKNIAKTLVYTQGARFRVDITDVIDAEVNASYAINHSDNTLQEANVNNNYRTITLGANGKQYILKDWTLSYDYTKTIYEGFTGATNPNILNTYVERRFLKGNVGTLRFAVNDVFNQNTGYTSQQNATFNSQSNVNRLGRYYMLTFTLRLQKFAGKGPQMGPGGPGGFRGPGGGPGGPPPGGGPGGPGGPSADSN